MKIKVETDVSVPGWVRNVALVVTPVAVVVATTAIVRASLPPNAFNDGDVLSAKKINDDFAAAAAGELGTGTCANSFPLQSATLTQITGLTAVTSVGPSRHIKVSAVGEVFVSNAPNGAGVSIHIFQDGTDAGAIAYFGVGNNSSATYSGFVVIESPVAGSHTYSVAASVNNGATGTFCSIFPARMLVEDLGSG